MKKILLLLAVLIMAITLCSCHEHKWTTAGCTTPQTCLDCGEVKGSALGHTWEDATCTSPKICSSCGTKEGAALGHNWLDATCAAPKTCSICGKTEGTLVNHDWEEATCTSPKTCSACGKTEGTLANHDWKDATCTSPKTCSACEKTEGTLANHDWKEATCTSPKTCAACGKTEGTLANHDWKDATCTSPKICAACGKQEGTVISHNWKNATCTVPKICSACGKTEGSAKGHNWETVNVYTKKCKTCGGTEIDQSKCPISLGSLAPCTGENYYTELNYTKQDIYGNKFSEGLNIRFYRHAFQSKWSPSTCTSEYALNGEYKKFTATILIDCNSDDTFEGNLKIYVDGVLKFDSNTMNKKTKAINLEVDISNAVFLKIEASRISVHGTIMLADPTLHH